MMKPVPAQLLSLATILLLPSPFMQPLRAEQLTATYIGPDTLLPWSDASNWSTSDFPANRDDETYDVIIHQGSVLVDQDIEINKLDLAAMLRLGSIGTEYDLTILNEFRWRSGFLLGNGANVHALGDFRLEGPANKETNNSALNLHGTTYWIDGAVRAYRSHWEIMPEAIFRIQTGNVLGDSSTSAATFMNHGAIIMEAEGETAELLVAIENAGLVEVASGTLVIGKDYIGRGNIDVALGAELGFRRRATFQNSEIANDGLIVFRYPHGRPYAEGTVHIRGRAQVHNGVDGPGDITFDDVEWHRGDSSGSGTLIVAEGGQAKILADGYFYRDIINRGIFHVSNARLVQMNSHYRNELTGHLLFDHGGSMPGYNAASIQNLGLMEKQVTTYLKRMREE